MPHVSVTLSTSDAARLTTCLDGIAEASSSARWAALDQLRYFCDGANAALLEAIGGKRFSTLAVLLELLDTTAQMVGRSPCALPPSISVCPLASLCSFSNACCAMPL